MMIITCCQHRQRYIENELNKRLGRPEDDPLEALTEGERVRLQQETELFAVPEPLRVGNGRGHSCSLLCTHVLKQMTCT